MPFAVAKTTTTTTRDDNNRLARTIVRPADEGATTRKVNKSYARGGARKEG